MTAEIYDKAFEEATMTEYKKKRKPLGGKSYGSVPHLIGSRRGPMDFGVNEGQQRICCEKKRDRHDTIIVQEKLVAGFSARHDLQAAARTFRRLRFDDRHDTRALR